MEAFVDSTVDRIHYLAERASILESMGLKREAQILYKEAEEQAAELRGIRVHH